MKTVHKLSVKPMADTIGNIVNNTYFELDDFVKDFVSIANIGGWLGILMGASVISLLEIIYFGIILLEIIFSEAKKKIHRFL